VTVVVISKVLHRHLLQSDAFQSPSGRLCFADCDVMESSACIGCNCDQEVQLMMLLHTKIPSFESFSLPFGEQLMEFP
jgi:hypothetical protein